MRLAEQAIVVPFERADVRINGDRSFDIKVNDKKFLNRLMRRGTLGFGESYMDRQWESDDLAELVSRLLLAEADEARPGFALRFLALSQKLLNMQSVSRASKNVERHYDLGNDLYRAMLDPLLVYTCGYWRTATNLAEAQEDKLDLVCRKLGLRPGQRVLDIGCGWGSFAKYAAEHYGARVVGITLSKDQLKLGKELCHGLDVELLYMDYRDLPRQFEDNPFDHIVSLGMFEHVGPKNFRTYMQTVRRVLKPEGLFLLHTIGGISGGSDPWMNKYVFPGGYIPTMKQIVAALDKDFITEDQHNFGADYDRTLCAWYENFSRNWSQLKATGAYNQRFFRMWRFYLLSCAGAFRARRLQLWQFVLSPHGVPGGYDRVS
jgi:cyclopropane-fatty-acyl-phospholipid synthase